MLAGLRVETTSCDAIGVDEASGVGAGDALAEGGVAEARAVGKGGGGGTTTGWLARGVEPVAMSGGRGVGTEQRDLCGAGCRGAGGHGGL
jgi:hypothetical protein